MVPVGTIVVGAALAGITVNAEPLQMVVVWFGITGVGLTVTVSVNGAPPQLPASPLVGVTV